MPSKHRVGGSNPSGQATYSERGEIGRHKGLKIPRPTASRFESGRSHQAPPHHMHGEGVATIKGCRMARSKKASNQNESMRVQTMEEWLAAGNRITICPPGMRSADLVEKHPQRRGRKSAKKKGD